MDKFFNKITAFIITAATIISIIGGGALWFYNYDSKFTVLASDVKNIQSNIEILELKQTLRDVMDEYFFLKKKVRQYPDDEELKEELKDVSKFKENLEQEIQKLEIEK